MHPLGQVFFVPWRSCSLHWCRKQKTDLLQLSENPGYNFINEEPQVISRWRAGGLAVKLPTYLLGKPVLCTSWQTVSTVHSLHIMQANYLQVFMLCLPQNVQGDCCFRKLFVDALPCLRNLIHPAWVFWSRNMHSGHTAHSRTRTIHIPFFPRDFWCARQPSPQVPNIKLWNDNAHPVPALSSLNFWCADVCDEK